VPVEFLTDEQAAAYGAFGEVPTRPELERFFFLDDDDRDLIALRRSDGHRLGMAVQICTVRYIGTFLGDDPLAVPWEVVDYLAGQLGIEDASCVKLSKAQTIERAPEPRKTALLTAVVRNLEAQAVDDALDLFALLMANRLINPARRASDKERLAVLPQLEKAARILAKASKILTEELDLVAEHGTDLDVAAVWAAVEETVPRAAVSGAVAMVEALVPEDDGSAEAAMREKLALRYNTVRPFLSLLGESDALGAAQGGKRILKAVRRLPALSRRRVKERPLLPREVDANLVPAMWRRAVFSNAKLPQGAVDRDAYVVCVLEQLHRALNRRDIFAAPSNRWADPRAQLLDGPRWEAMRGDVLAGLSLNEDVGEHLAGLTRGLDAAWRQMADRLAEAGDEAKVEIVVPEGGGRARLSVDKLGAVGEPESLTWLKNTTEAILPRVDLPDLLFEVHSWTGFLDAFKHVSARPTRMEGLLVSLVALLVSESCNIGLTPVCDPNERALTRSRLSHVDQKYLRADTIAAANAALITAQGRVELAQRWGGGMLASVDGLRFVVPVKSINTGPSPKYYGYKRGLTWLNAVNDQVAGIGAMVVRGTPRDSLFTLDTLLNLDGGVRPEMVATDNASYSDMAFGLYKMLGFRFAPRFRDLADQRFWRADVPVPEGEEPAGDYGRSKPSPVTR
jgi:TnpA family transposase